MNKTREEETLEKVSYIGKKYCSSCLEICDNEFMWRWETIGARVETYFGFGDQILKINKCLKCFPTRQDVVEYIRGGGKIKDKIKKIIS